MRIVATGATQPTIHQGQVSRWLSRNDIDGVLTSTYSFCMTVNAESWQSTGQLDTPFHGIGIQMACDTLLMCKGHKRKEKDATETYVADKQFKFVPYIDVQHHVYDSSVSMKYEARKNLLVQ